MLTTEKDLCACTHMAQSLLPIGAMDHNGPVVKGTSTMRVDQQANVAALPVRCSRYMHDWWGAMATISTRPRHAPHSCRQLAALITRGDEKTLLHEWNGQCCAMCDACGWAWLEQRIGMACMISMIQRKRLTNGQWEGTEPALLAVLPVLANDDTTWNIDCVPHRACSPMYSKLRMRASSEARSIV